MRVAADNSDPRPPGKREPSAIFRAAAPGATRGVMGGAAARRGNTSFASALPSPARAEHAGTTAGHSLFTRASSSRISHVKSEEGLAFPVQRSVRNYLVYMCW